MRILLVAVAVLALMGATATSRVDATGTERLADAKSLAPTLGISYRAPGGALAWFDPLTLRMLPGRKAPLGGHLGSWAFSADRAVLAIAHCGGPENQIPQIRFVNARTMRVLGDLRLSPFVGCASSLTWLRPDRLLAFLHTTGGSELAVVDPLARRVVSREVLPAKSSSLAIGRTRDELVLLVASSGDVAPVQLAVIDSEGAVRVETIDRVPGGSVVDQASGEYRSRIVSPGLAVDPDGRRAFLVPAAGPVAEVDLRTLAVSYHELDRPSLMRRFLRWLMPTAQAKLIEGPVRDARWLGGGMIAVSGMDHSVAASGKGELRPSMTPAGVRLIDTRAWTSRMLSNDASGFAVAPGIVIAQGGHWDYLKDRGFGAGVLAFSLDGHERWRLHTGEYRWMDPCGSVGYLYIAERETAEVVDLATGRVLGTVRWSERNPLPQVLAEQVSGW